MFLVKSYSSGLTMKRKKSLLLLVFLGLAVSLATPAGATFYPRPHFDRSIVKIIRKDKKSFHFTVEVADTARKQAYGLMDVDSLSAKEGMIFPYKPPQQASFWMKNTRIPLDILFVRADGTIGRIARARALDVTPIPSNGPVAAVIEIKGGLADKYGLEVGDKVESPVLQPPPGPSSYLKNERQIIENMRKRK